MFGHGFPEKEWRRSGIGQAVQTRKCRGWMDGACQYSAVEVAGIVGMQKPAVETRRHACRACLDFALQAESGCGFSSVQEAGWPLPFNGMCPEDVGHSGPLPAPVAIGHPRDESRSPQEQACS